MRRIRPSASPSAKQSAWQRRCSARSGRPGSYTPPRSAARFKGGGVGPSPTYSYSAAVVEVDVDPATGWIHVPARVDRARHRARSTRRSCADRSKGSVYMALGEALMEEQIFRRLPPRLSHALVHKFPSMLEYKSPTTLDMPEVFTELIEHPDPRGPFGAKEVGQGPLLPIMPAVANAVYDAVGVRIDEVPITPEKILKALHAAGGGQTAARSGSGVDSRTSRGPSAACVAPLGGRRRGRLESTRSGLVRASKPTKRGPMIRLPAFRLSRRAPSREAAVRLGRVAGQTHARRRRHRPLPEHETAPAGAAHDRRFASDPRSEGRRLHRRRGLHEARATPGSWCGRWARIREARTGCRQRHRLLRRSFGTWERSAATSASIRAATGTTRATSGAKRSTLREEGLRHVLGRPTTAASAWR